MDTIAVVFVLALSAIAVALFTDRLILDGASPGRGQIVSPYLPYKSPR